ncbi:pentapeptide repeat-containing protein [Cronbergia sp. UHCC 0137]|uniref:pentapeptide repeat-containing protein n=1 Tax=Cronbergia sp. UHCC 0137 TaxID=3110239 RepID=UPI002B1E96F1|nr:pentapeptide repeat-containing protein [Cronbergia sp. UHCC 0137]MEA5616590.1 pentapeptide repeat-containing protein [Cronbergia sp. UHCC 0137]
MNVEELLSKYAAGVLDFIGVDLAETNLSGAKLIGINLSQANLSVINLSGANLTEANLSYAKLNVGRLSGANLTDAILNNSSLNVANLMGTNFTHAQMRDASLVRSELIRADLTRADLSDANLNSANLREATLRQTNLRRANLSEANLRSCLLREANLEMANLNTTDISCADLSGANLRDSELRQANLCLTNLSGADLSGANLRWADLRGANLRWADLSRAKLSGANLTGADLSNANFTNASLVHTNLTQAKLVKVEWLGADLSGAILTGAKLYGTARFGLKTEGITCEWVDLSPKGDRTIIQHFTPEELREFFNATPPTIRIIVDAPLEHEANFVLAGTYYQIAQEYQELIHPPSMETGSRRTILTFRLDSDEALFPKAYMAIMPFKDSAATQKSIETIMEMIRQEMIDHQSFKSPNLVQQITLLTEEAINKSKTTQQTKKYLDLAVKLGFFKAPTQIILTNSSAQTLTLYDNPSFGKKIINRPTTHGVPEEHTFNEVAYIMPSLNVIVDFIQGFYYNN